MKKEIDKYMSVKEAAYRYDVNVNTLKEKLKGRTESAKEMLATLKEDGLVKYFRVPGDQNGTWIISKEAMDLWFGKK